jgi:putative CocE/NonD family hydrolase
VRHDTARQTPTYDEYWRLQDAESLAANITAPAVHVGGWFDFYPQGTLNNFASRRYLGGPGARGNQMLVIGPWEHAITAKVGDLAFSNHRFDYNALAWRFFRHWLKCDPADGIMDEPAVHYYVLGDGDDPQAPGNCWRAADNWPPFSTREKSYYLSGDGRLKTDMSEVKEGQCTYIFDPANPCPSLGGADAIKPLPLDQRPISSRPDVLKFSTEPLAEPIEITGQVRVKLFVSSDAPDTDFTAKFIDIYPDGREIAILNGTQRVKFRKGFDAPDPLPIGTVGELTLDCWSISIIINKGHCIGIQISSSNWPRYEVNPNTGADLPA